MKVNSSLFDLNIFKISDDKSFEVINRLITSKDLSSEILNIFKSKRDEFTFKMKLTSKDEFDVLSKRVENLENKISKLETKKKKKTRSAKRS